MKNQARRRRRTVHQRSVRRSLPAYVITVDVEQQIEEIRLPNGFTSAHVVVLSGATPVGSMTIAGYDGVVSSARLHDGIRGHIGDMLAEIRLGRAVRSGAIRGEIAERINAALAVEPPYRYRSQPLTLSICVCTRDRPDDLRLCLDAIAAATDSGAEDGIEVIVVDNAPKTRDRKSVV